jgi:hypothetical protein
MKIKHLPQVKLEKFNPKKHGHGEVYWGFYDMNINVIVIREDAPFLRTLVHEFIHWIIWSIFPDSLAPEADRAFHWIGSRSFDQF